jgi:peptide/nickel transport system substrate-binding protein
MIARVVAAALVAAFLAVGAGAATPKRGGTVVFVPPPGAISCLNPLPPCDADVLSQVLEGAFEPGGLGPGYVYLPYLVSGVTVGRHPLTLTYHIRPQARWSDGVPVTAADFRFTYQTYKTHGDEDARELHERIRWFRTLGPKTFRVELRQPFDGWRDLFYEVLPRHALAGEDITKVWRDRVDNLKTGQPIGSGPFLVSRLESGRQLVLVRNPNYWGPHKAYLDRFIIRWNVLDPADPLGPLRRHEIDFVGMGGLLRGRAADVRRLPGWEVASWPASNDEHLVFRIGPGGHSALKKNLVRRALAYGIDRVQLARRVYAALGRRARPLDSTTFFPGESSYRPNWSMYRYDPARARRLLAQAGCKRGADRIYSCAGERLRLRFITTAGNPARELALRLMVPQLRRAGVEVEPAYVPMPAFFSTVLPGGDFDAALFAWTTVPGGYVPGEAICGEAGNYTGSCSPLIRRDVQRVDRIIVDPAQRARVLNALDLKLAGDVRLLPLYQPAFQFAHTFKGFAPAGSSGATFLEQTEDWWLER